MQVDGVFRLWRLLVLVLPLEEDRESREGRGARWLHSIKGDVVDEG